MFWQPKTITMWKRIGETPREAVERLRAARPRLRDSKLAYAGRLDPMAEGKLLVVVGDACTQMVRYTGLDKTYEVEILFGVESDTGDILGIVQCVPPHAPVPTERTIADALEKRVGDIQMCYPAYSSKTVSGKPLFEWALLNRLSEIDIPVRDSRIYRARLCSVQSISSSEVMASVRTRIAALATVTEPSKELGRDFRRKEVLASWEQVLASGPESFLLARIEVTCSSGTYMRSLASLLAQDLGTHGLAFSITRTWIGKWRTFLSFKRKRQKHDS